jgi:tRNA(adenine34) deaminase
MDRLLRRAAVVGEAGEVPVAAVVLDRDGRAVGWGSNRRHHGQDPLGHAEIVALRQAAAFRGDWRFSDCTLVVTLEPCPMCAGALIQARMGTVVFGGLLVATLLSLFVVPVFFVVMKQWLQPAESR